MALPSDIGFGQVPDASANGTEEFGKDVNIFGVVGAVAAWTFRYSCSI